MNGKCVPGSLGLLGAVLGMLVLAPVSSATNPQSKGFLRSHLNLRLCYYNDDNEMDFLYYKGLAEVLNSYISQRVMEGALRPKKVEINVACLTPWIDAGPIVEVRQSHKRYDILVAKNREPNLHQLVRIVNYFSSRNWESFCCYDRLKNDAASRTFDRILDREVGEPDMSFFVGRRQVVFQRDELRVIYEADHLYYELAGRRLDLKPDGPLPVKVRDRYLFGIEGALVVYGRDGEVRRKAISCDPSGFVTARAYARWVNIDISRCGGGALAYSYDKNRFYRVESLPSEFWR